MAGSTLESGNIPAELELGEPGDDQGEKHNIGKDGEGNSSGILTGKSRESRQKETGRRKKWTGDGGEKEQGDETEGVRFRKYRKKTVKTILNHQIGDHMSKISMQNWKERLHRQAFNLKARWG